MKQALAAIFSAASLLVSSAAFASPDYPADINIDLGISCAPQPCTVCHATSSGGGVPVTGFGIALVSEGLVVGSPASLKAALTAADQKKLGGSPSYIDSLKACKDPNAASGGGAVQTIGYGCSTSGSGGIPGGAMIAVSALCALALGRKLRR
jgi:hypothetical protein